MAVDVSQLSGDPTQDPFYDPAQSQSDSSADLSQSTVDFFGGTGLSGDTYNPSQQNPGQSALPISNQGSSIPINGPDPNKVYPLGTHAGLTAGQGPDPNKIYPLGTHAGGGPDPNKIYPLGTHGGQMPASLQGEDMSMPNDQFGGILGWEKQHLSPEVRATLNPAAQGLLPTAGALGAGVAGAAIGTALFPGLGTVGGFLIGLGAGAIGGIGADWLQSKAMDSVMSPEDKQAWQSEQQTEGQYPIQQAVGTILPQIATMRFNPKGTVNAIQLLGRIVDSPRSARAVIKAANPDDLQNLLYLGLGGGQAAKNAYEEVQKGNFSPASFAITNVASVLFNRPRWIGQPTLDKTLAEGHGQANAAAAEGTTGENPGIQDALNENNQIVRQLGDLKAKGALDTDPKVQELQQKLDENHTKLLAATSDALNPEVLNKPTPEEAQAPQAPVAETPAGAPDLSAPGAPVEDAAKRTGATPDELRASIVANQQKTQDMQAEAFNYQRRQLAPGEYLNGTEDEQIARSQSLPEDTKAVLKRMRSGSIQKPATLFSNQRAGLQTRTGQDLYQLLLDDGGFTYDINSRTQPKQGWAVSPYKDRELVVPPGGGGRPQIINDYVQKNLDLLEQPEHHLGAWVDPQGNTYFDVSVVAPDRNTALQLAGNHQQSIYNIGTGQEFANPNYNPVETQPKAGSIQKQAFQNGDRVQSPSGNTGTILGKGQTSSRQFSGDNLYQVRWDNGASTTISGEKLNGIQPQATGNAEETGFVNQAGQSGITEETSNTGQVGGQADLENGFQTNPQGIPTGSTEIGAVPSNAPTSGSIGFASRRPGASTIQPSDVGTGNVYPNGPAGGNVSGNGNGGTSIAFDYSPQSFATRGSEAASRGTTHAENSAQTGIAGWSASSDLAEFVPQVHQIAESIGVDLSQAPMFRGAIRLLPEEHQELANFLAGKGNDTKNITWEKGNLYIPDDPRFLPEIPRKSAMPWEILKTANTLTDRLKALGFPVDYVPNAIRDDATRVALALKGWNQRFFYENARAFPDTLDWSTARQGAREQWRAFQAVFGDGTKVLANARSVILHNSRLEAGVYANPKTGQQFDPAIRNQLIGSGVIPLEGQYPFSDTDLVRASEGMMPASRKTNDYGGGLSGEARAPIDRWMARLGLGLDNTPTTKLYDYEFGRLNYVTRMFAAHDPTILPSHVQSAMWYGYQQLVAEKIAALKLAAKASGDQELMGMADSMRGDLVSKDLAEVFRETYQLGENSKPQILPIDKILGDPNLRSQLIVLSQQITRRFLKGDLGAITKSGKAKDLEDTQVNEFSIETQLKRNNVLRNKLAAYYKESYIDAPRTKPGVEAIRQSINQTLGWAAERVAQIAYRMNYANQRNATLSKAIENLGMQVRPDRVEVGEVPTEVINQRLPWISNLVHDGYGIPRGAISLGMNHDIGGDYTAYYNTETRGVTLNGPLLGYNQVVAATDAQYLQNALTTAKDLTGPARQKFERVVGEAAMGNDSSVLHYVLAHEAGHFLQDRFWHGQLELLERSRVTDKQLTPLASSILKDMTTNPKYMIGLVREGLGNEVEALIWADAKSKGKESSLNELLGGIEGAKPQGQLMPLQDAIHHLIEHQTYQYAAYKGVPHSHYSLATDEVFRRNVHEPEIAEANWKELGKIYDQKTREIADALAIEASARSSGGGPNPAIDPSLLDVSEARAGVAAFSKYPARTFQSSTSGWSDLASPNQESVTSRQLDLGERVLDFEAAAQAIHDKMAMPFYKPAYGDQETLDFLNAKVAGLRRSVEDPDGKYAESHTILKKANKNIDFDLRTATADAAKLPKSMHESVDSYAQRVVQASDKYDTLSHAVSVLRAASSDGIWSATTRGDKVGFELGGKFYEGTPKSHVDSWDRKFHGVIKSALTKVDEETALANEPATESPTHLDAQVLKQALDHQPNTPAPIRSTAKEGAVRIFDKTGKAIPAMSKEEMKAMGQAIPSAQLSPETAANMAEAAHDHFQDALEIHDDLADNPIFDPLSPEKLAARQAEIAAIVEAPSPVGNGSAPPKVTSPKGQKEVVQQQLRQNSAVVFRGYAGALKQARTVDNPAVQGIVNGLNDVMTGILGHWNVAKWGSDPRTWSDDAINTTKAVAMVYQRVGKQVTDLVSNLPAVENESANERISNAIGVEDENQRQALLKGLSPEEAAIADMLHHYWKVLGDTGLRANVLTSYLEHYLPLIAVKDPEGKNPYNMNGVMSAQLRHAIDRIERSDGTVVFKKPSELQAHLDNKYGKGWQVKTDLGDLLAAQGKAVSQSLIMKTAVDRLSNDIEMNIGGVSARPIGAKSYLDNLPYNWRDHYREVKIGPWKGVLSRSAYDEPQMVWKPLADQMERAASAYDVEDGKFVGLAKKINTANSWFKQYKFISPVHIYSLLSNMSAMKGVTQLHDVLHLGRDIVEGANRHEGSWQRYFELIRAGLPDFEDRIPEAMSGVSGVLQRLPVAGKFFQFQHDVTWRQTGYYGLVGLTDKLSQEYVADFIRRNPEEQITDSLRASFDREAGYQARKSLGYLTSLDMSKNWDLYGNVLLLANRWTTSQLRSLGDAFNVGPLKGIAGPLARLGGGARVVEAPNAKVMDYLQKKNIAMAQRLVWGGTARLALTSFALSTALSAIMNNGVPSTPYQNYLKDPNHVFDIYAGRDPNTNRDQWIRLPFFLFQREMVDWAMSGVKALNEGQPLLDPNHLGTSAVFAPFERFSSKADPISRLGLELVTGKEIGMWMKGYTPDKSNIDEDKYVTNINKSLQAMGVPDFGSLENRLLYAFQQLSPSVNFPTDLNTTTADPGAVASALGLGTFNPFASGNLKNMAMGMVGTREDPGTRFVQNDQGQEVPIYQQISKSQQKNMIGDQIIQIAGTLGTATPSEEVQKLQQIEALRVQAGYTPGQLSELILFKGSTSSSGSGGSPGLIYQNLPNQTGPKTVKNQMIGGKTLSDQQQVVYDEVSAQRQEFAIAQLLSSPDWASLDKDQRIAEANLMTRFANRITGEQMGQALGSRPGQPISNGQANAMLVELGAIKKQTQNDLLSSPAYRSADPDSQKVMMSDRITATQSALWSKYFGTMKGATDYQLIQYVDLQTGLRDEVRQVLGTLDSYQQAPDQYTQAQMLSMNLNFADNLVSQAVQGKSPKTFSSPLTQQQLYMAVRNGVVLQDAALQQLHSASFYNTASPATQHSLDTKYVTLAHNIALYDLREGVQSRPDGGGFDNALRSQVVADQAYDDLLTQFFGPNGQTAYDQYARQLSDLKAQYRQENVVPPNQLSKLDANINRWFYQNNPQYGNFLKARTDWEKRYPLGQLYKATTQANLAFEADSPLSNLVNS